MDHSKVKIYIINGMGRAGKDTFAQYVNEAIVQLTNHERSVFKLSTIDWPKEVCKFAGWDGYSKSDKDRKFMSDINLALEAWDDSPLCRTLDRIIGNFEVLEHGFFFVDLREPYRIERFKKMCQGEGFQVFTVFITRPDIDTITSNAGDASTLEPYDYDFYIENNGTLYDFQQKAHEFAQKVILEDCES